jgi:hypothetical protein
VVVQAKAAKDNIPMLPKLLNFDFMLINIDLRLFTFLFFYASTVRKKMSGNLRQINYKQMLLSINKGSDSKFLLYFYNHITNFCYENNPINKG